MAKTNTALAVAVGLALGAGVTYVIFGEGLPTKKKRSGTAPPPEPKDVPPEDPRGGYHRLPLPNTMVTIPMTPDGRRALDAQICKAIQAFEEPPDLPDVALTTLELMAPHVDWPAVPGDNQSIVALQSMVTFRVDQVATKEVNKSTQENLADFCKPKFDLTPTPGGGLTPHEVPGG